MNKILIVIGIFFSIGCGDDGSVSRICDPGVTQACLCASSKAGVQSCNANGTGWETCLGCSGKVDGGINNDFDVSSDQMAKCTASQSGCSADKIVQCNTATGVLSVVEDCSKKNYGEVKFSCNVCSGVPTCLPPSDMFTGEVSKFIGYKYTYRDPDCNSSIAFKIDAWYILQFATITPKQFYHYARFSNYTIQIRFYNITENYSNTFLGKINAGRSDVEISISDGSTGCKNFEVSKPKTPTDLGTVKATFTKLGLGGAYTFSIDGLVDCGSEGWKPLKYEAKGFIKVVK